MSVQSLKEALLGMFGLAQPMPNPAQAMPGLGQAMPGLEQLRIRGATPPVNSDWAAP